MASRKKRASRKQPAITPRQQPAIAPRRQFMQIAVTFVLPCFCFGALGSLLKVEHPLVALAVFPLALAGALALGYWMRVAAKTVAAASTRPVPRPLYGLAGLCLIALTVALARLSYAESHASGNAAFSITSGFLALYCAIGGVLALGRALARGPSRLAFWVFVPRWLDSEAKQPQSHDRATDHA